MGLKKEKFTQILDDIDLGDITETKKLSLLDEIGTLLTRRIILELIARVPEEKKQVFIDKINENKDDPDKVLLFIDHFVDDADSVIDAEIDKYTEELALVVDSAKK
jgi:hypothetical protein